MISVWSPVGKRFPEHACNKAAARCVAAYREHMAYLAAQPLLARSYERLDLDRLQTTATQASLRQEIKRAAKRARRRKAGNDWTLKTLPPKEW